MGWEIQYAGRAATDEQFTTNEEAVSENWMGLK
jgi:hypothetical protein